MSLPTFIIRYSLVLNRRRASCIRHNLDFPWSSCIAIMFLSKKVGLSCISPWFSTFPACFIAWWCHCYIYGGMPCLLIHPGLWVICSAVLVLHQGFQKKYSMSSNTTRLLLSTREYIFTSSPGQSLQVFPGRFPSAFHFLPCRPLYNRFLSQGRIWLKWKKRYVIRLLATLGSQSLLA